MTHWHAITTQTVAHIKRSQFKFLKAFSHLVHRWCKVARIELCAPWPLIMCLCVCGQCMDTSISGRSIVWTPYPKCALIYGKLCKLESNLCFLFISHLIARNTLPLHCVIERTNPSLLSPGGGVGTGSSSGQQQQQPTGTGVSTNSPPLNPSTSSASAAVTDLSMSLVGGPTSSTPGSGSAGTGTGPGASSANANSPTVIEQDNYVILSASIPLNDIVRSVLTKLGYAPQEMVGAKGE